MEPMRYEHRGKVTKTRRSVGSAMQSGRGSGASDAPEQPDERDSLLNGHPALLRLRTWIAVNDPIRLTMREAADLACVELHYFSAIFRKHTGRSFIEWRRSIRIARAAHL